MDMSLAGEDEKEERRRRRLATHGHTRKLRASSNKIAEAGSAGHRGRSGERANEHGDNEPAVGPMETIEKHAGTRPTFTNSETLAQYQRRRRRKDRNMGKQARWRQGRRDTHACMQPRELKEDERKSDGSNNASSSAQVGIADVATIKDRR